MTRPYSHTARRTTGLLLIGVAVVTATAVHSFNLPETIVLGGLLVWLPLARYLASHSFVRSEQHAHSSPSTLLDMTFWPCVVTAAASTFFPRGSLSGAITVFWTLWTVAATSVSILRYVNSPSRSLPQFVTTVSSGYLTVSAIWFTCWRSLINPLDFPDGITLLTSVHFLYAGFLLPVISTGLLPDALAIRHRLMLSGMILMMPVIAVGITCSPTVEIVGVILAMLVVVMLCGELVIISTRSDRPVVARVLLKLAVVCGVLAVGLAVYYGFSEYTGNTWILIPTMIRWHGLLNSLGLIGGTLTAWALSTFNEAQSELPSAIAAVPSRLWQDSSLNNSERYRESYASTDNQNR